MDMYTRVVLVELVVCDTLFYIVNEDLIISEDLPRIVKDRPLSEDVFDNSLTVDLICSYKCLNSQAPLYILCTQSCTPNLLKYDLHNIFALYNTLYILLLSANNLSQQLII